MKQLYLTLLLVMAGLLAGVQTAKAQKVVLHMKSGKTFECSLSQMDSITLSLDEAKPKVRVGIYETIPGYSVQDVTFYADASTDTRQTSCVLFANADGETMTFDFGKLAEAPLGITIDKASFAGEEAAGYYSTFFPTEAGASLTLRADYTLVAADGSGEVIHVENATAQVPAAHAGWERDKAYTYIFKVYQVITPWTAGQDFCEVFPIQLDKVVVESCDDSVLTR